MITVYMDKLHALELLLVEELEYSVEQDDKANSPMKQTEEQVLNQIFGQSVRIQDMPADDVKRKLVDFKENEQQVPPPPPLMAEKTELAGLLSLPIADPASKEWQISLDELQFKKRIGRGSAGTTYLAKWSGKTVAVKVAAITEMGLEGWQTEVQSLQRLHHPNVIRLLGSVYNENPLTYCLVLEYCNAGDLSQALQIYTPPNFFFSVANDIANGMAYLHSRGVLHRDIKPSNVLLEGNVSNGTFAAKVSDFGVATTFEDDANRTAETGTYRWMAPEVIRHESYSSMADVYSYAILCWQLLTRENPFESVSPLEAAGKVALEHARPPFPRETPQSIQALISICWEEDPAERLPFDQVSKSLDELKDSVLAPEELTWLQAPMGHPVYKSAAMESKKAAADLAPKLQVPGPVMKPPLDDKHKQQDRRGNGFRSIFGKYKK